MGPTWISHTFLIQWLHCITVYWCVVSIETEFTKESIPEKNVSRPQHYKPQSDNLPVCVQNPIVICSAPCPPANSLHEICKLGRRHHLTCEERTTVLTTCYNKYSSIYRKSNWKACLFENSFCQSITDFLIREGLINKNGSYPISITTTKMTSTITTTTTTTTNATTTLHTTMSTVPTTHAITTLAITTLNSSSTSSVIPFTDGTSASLDALQPVSYILLILGVLFITVEIIVLCIVYHDPKKKCGSPSKGYRRASNCSMVLQPEIQIQPVNAQTTHSAPSPAQDEESYFAEDERIFDSYLNLRFIDDISQAGTPRIKHKRTV